MEKYMKPVRTFNTAMVALLAGLLLVSGYTGAIAGNDPSLDTGMTPAPAAVAVAAH